MHRTSFRRGSATIWLILALPVLLVLFCFTLNIAQQWLARVELENALEAAALAAVKEWGDANGGDTIIPREVGVEYAQLNWLRGVRVQIGDNYDPAGGVNQNKRCDIKRQRDGNLIFGAITRDDPAFPVTFNAGVQPSCPPEQALAMSSVASVSEEDFREFAVRAQATVKVPPLCRCLCAFNDHYCVTAKATAVYDCQTRQAKLIRVDRFICPGP